MRSCGTKDLIIRCEWEREKFPEANSEMAKLLLFMVIVPIRQGEKM